MEKLYIQFYKNMYKKTTGNTLKVISILNDLNFHDGESIGREIGITRAGIWKIIQKLKMLGIEIYTNNSLGYKIDKPLYLIDVEYLKKKISDDKLVIDVFEELDSTNQYLKRITDTNPMLCIAEKQTSGKGRMGRLWHSPYGKNIYMSLTHVFQKDASALSGLSLAVGISCLKAIAEFFEINEENLFQIKWPNDGMYQKKKFMGNLIEIQSESNGFTKVFIGIGINVNMVKCEDEINRPWTSLKQITNNNINRNNLILILYQHIMHCLNEFDIYGFQNFYRNWYKYDCLTNEEVILNNGKIKGVAKGIDINGNLLIEGALGDIQSFSSGEVTSNQSYTFKDR